MKAYPYLFVDARYEKVRVGGRVVSQGVLVVSGVRDDGFREILAVEVADTESEATYHELFRSLKARGLCGIELVVSDDHQGLRRRRGAPLPGASWQRCQVHFARNLLGMVRPWQAQGALGRPARSVRRTEQGSGPAPHLELAARWRHTHPRVSEHLEEHIEECLSCLAFPESHRRRIRTTNGLERLNQEIKRQDEGGEDLPQPRGVPTIGYGVGNGALGGWLTGRRYLDMHELEEQRRQEEQKTEEVALMER